MSAPNLIWWFPLILVQLLTNWTCCSLSVRGQLHRATPKPSPKLEITRPCPLFAGAPPYPLIASGPSWKEPSPAVLGSSVFAHGMPKSVIGVPPSGFCVCGLYLNQPNRKSVNSELLKVFVKPVARL